jgi:membrane peptidoglycan carboxypeptidase
MAEVTQPGMFHTAGSAHLEGIDFGGKTGTAQVMSHEALGKTAKGRITNPNVWFVGVTPSRNPELVVAVLWQNGEFSYYPARIGAKVVSAYVEKQRRLAHNLVPVKATAPVEMSAVWTLPASASGTGGKQDRMQGGRFLIQDGQIVAQAKPKTPGAGALKGRSFSRAGNESKNDAAAEGVRIAATTGIIEPKPRPGAESASASAGKGQ